MDYAQPMQGVSFSIPRRKPTPGSARPLWKPALGGKSGRKEDVEYGLIAGGLFAVTFLIGQLFAWQQLNAAGYFLAANPANAFFYLLTGVHGLHLLGGLVALALTADKVWRGFEVNQVRLSVQLCAVYWHFLLALWLVLFTLLTPWVGDFADICRQLLT